MSETNIPEGGEHHVFQADEKGEPLLRFGPIRSDLETQRFNRRVTHGHAAYEAYCEERDWLAYNKEPLRDWSEVDPEIKMAWELAAGAAIHNYQKNPGNEE